MTQADLGDESVEPYSSDAAATHAEIVIDDKHLRPWPAQADGSIHQAVLPALALEIVGDLLDGGLADVDGSLASEVRRRDLHAAHGWPSNASNQRVSS